jgi:mannose-1-phosphate guanylyltransferase
VAAAQHWPDRLTLLGVEPDGPETSYGWIAPREPLGMGTASELYSVRRFWEKPDRQTAARLFARGYFWNTLVVAGRLEAHVKLAEASMPKVLAPLRAIADSLGTPAEETALREAYGRIPPTNLSQALLVRRPEALVLLAARGVCWSDWGDPERIVQTLRRFDRRPSWLPAYARVPEFGPGAAG